MDIKIEAKPIKTMIVPWLYAFFTLSVLFFILIVALYFIIASSKFSFVEFLFKGSNAMIWFYVPIYSLFISFQSRMSTISVKQCEGFNLSSAVELFNKLKWFVVSEQNGFIKFEKRNWFERLFLANTKATIELAENEVIFNIPSQLVYHIHHGFKFGGFIKKEKPLE